MFIVVDNGFTSRSKSDEMIIKPPKDITKYEITLSLSMEANVQNKKIFPLKFQSHFTMKK
jgi:hypothetical protein